mgnify:CR=1 FL=1
MKKYFKIILNRIIQIFFVSLLTISVDYLIFKTSHNDSIWLGESIEAVASIIFGPVVGGISTFINCVLTDFLVYGTLEFFFVGIFEALSMTLIGLIYRRLIKDEDTFGVKEIVIFNFIQVVVNTAVIYLATPPAAVLFFEFIVKEWGQKGFVEEMLALSNDAFSACFSVALIGTTLLALCIAIRRHLKKTGNFVDAIKSFLKPCFISNEYRPRALIYSIGIIFSIALTMVDGIISGHTLGQDALAATSIMFPLISLSTYISNIITSGCSNLCASAKGNGDYKKAKKLFTLGFFTTLVLGVLQIIFFFLIQDFYFDYFATTEKIEILARQYYQIYIFVPPFMAMTTFLDEIISSDGDDVLSYAGYVVSFITNVGLSIFLSKSIGMSGLALATMISYICYLIVVSIHFFKKDNTYSFIFYFSVHDLISFSERSLKSNIQGLCMFLSSTAFTKAILLFWGSDYLIANTVLCAMLEIYEIVNGPSEAAEYLIASYEGEKNDEGIIILFKEALSSCLFGGTIVSFILLLFPNIVLALYGVEDSPLRFELITCIRFCSVGVIAASVGGFLSDYYGDIGKPLWSCLLIIFRTALFPILFCVTFCVDGGTVAMGKGLLLSQIAAVAIFFGFVLIVNGSKSIPFMLDDPDYEKVDIISFEFTPKEHNRGINWINDYLIKQGINDNKINNVKNIVLSLFDKIEEKREKNKVYGECVFRFIKDPEIIIKDNGVLFKPDITDDHYSYNVLMSCNRSTIHI